MDLNLTLRLRALLATYKGLRDDSGLTPQKRGQAFNTLIAEVLKAWGHDARPSVIGVGGRDETDVFFTIGYNYILEAKWEATPLSADPLTKLSERLSTRPPGTRAIVLSASGFNSHALEWINRHNELLLMDLSHIEAALCGLLDPEELLNRLYGETAASGNRLVPLADIVVPRHAEPEVPVLTRAAAAPPPWPIIKTSTEGADASVEFTGVWESDQHPSGISAAPANRLLITTNTGVVELHTTTGKTKWALALPGTEDRAVHNTDGSVTVLCRGALLRWHPRTRDLQLVAGGFGGYATLEAGRDGTLWVYNQIGGLVGGSVTISRIGDRPGDETRYDIPFPNGMRAVHLADERHFLSGSGHSTPVDVSKSPSADEKNWIVSAVPNPRAAAGPDEQTIFVASTRSSLDGSLQCLDLGKAPASWTELLTFTANRATDLTVERTSATRAEGWLLADASGNTQNPTPVLVKLTLPTSSPS
ncbi:restriction endonuclease [Streptomyces sp. NPDC127114]|uniref:restriction endonuclease n=1 Tax=Streptomyces sp. NPDC127114 TaxID=3345366 RepID=UPI003640CF77